MTIILISDLAGIFATRRREAADDHGKLREGLAAMTSPASESEGVPSPASPAWSVPQSNEVFIAAVAVASAIFRASGEVKDHTGMHDCTMRVLQAARDYAAESGLDHRKIVAGLADVATIIEKNTSPFHGPGPSEEWWKHDARLASVMLPVICRVYETQKAHEEKLAIIRESIAREGTTRRPEGRMWTAKEAAEEFRRKLTAKQEGKGPVVIFGDRVVVECRPEEPGPTWSVALDDIPNPTRLLKWVSDLTAKTWCTAEMVRDFVGMVCSAKGWEIYAAPDSNPGTAAA
ncbi:hypothetical protein [Luteolibacter soli]|uniref:Uncharacterized protein n=1 Tax=Luteolibacter soli TaxID=3135280 RepID=A0ABU9B1C0_9BACT